MAKQLVIVESPAKAKTIGKYLGSGYVVKSSVGHIRDLRKSTGKRGGSTKKPAAKRAKGLTDKQRLVRKLSVDPYNHWKADYEILPGKEKVLKDLKAIAQGASAIYLATDLDREGEAIAWHLKEALGGEAALYKRVIFSEITQKAIQKAFSSPTEVNIHRVYAQQTRRFLDRVVGFMVSPLLWEKVARGLSAGRVQSVAVRLIVEREREIKSFLPQEYWQLSAGLEGFEDVRVRVTKHAEKPYSPGSQEESHKHVEALKDSLAKIVKREDKLRSSKPQPPFITSTLQQGASRRLGFGVSRCMSLAQKLYEAGHITYMRTDSTHVSADAINHCRDLISTKFGAAYLPDKPQSYSKKAHAQEAHEAIRPSDVYAVPGSLQSRLDKDQFRLYDLIWRRFVASQMSPTTHDISLITLKVQDYELKASGKRMRFDGFQKVLPSVKRKIQEDKDAQKAASASSVYGADADMQLLPSELKEGLEISLKDLDPTQHFTKPAPRFSEARFVQELEKRGIGRPSTYAAIISTIQDRGYVKIENRRFYALKMGEVVTNKLQQNFADLMDYAFTAKMEEKLDEIAVGGLDWQETLDTFFQEFTDSLAMAKTQMPQALPTPTDIFCEKCGAQMMLRTATTGVFLSCSHYSQKSEKGKEERCKCTMSLYEAKDFLEVMGDSSQSYEDMTAEDQQLVELRSQQRCPVCSTAMDAYIVDQKRKLHVCGRNPECSGTVLQHGSFRLKGYDGPTIICDRCGADMELKNGRFGKYFDCTECDNKRKLLKNGEVAPPKADPVPMPELPCKQSEGYFILRDGAAGIFLASSMFPASRETIKPKVEDLLRHRDELDSKFLYLADAPKKDPEGRDFIIRFSRKTKEHFLASLTKEGKPSKWNAYYQNGAWQILDTKKSKSA